ncbi:tyrosine-type recombinase/integrase [Bengtsoniella intestinalis]|uniref:tyrosine-type recombinase/integrase n=1 Tax=Bengtsoniella intestinalis TaxID=3073143 RepID=UPI00391F459F
MFDDFCMEHNLDQPLLPQTLFDLWCEKRPHENGTTHRMRVQQIRQFSKFLTNNGIEAPTVFLPLPQIDKTFLPYIFTHDEIQRLLTAVDRIKPCTHHGRESLVHLVMPLLFRILYCCGLRIGEALKIKTEDVDFHRGTLRLTETKNNRERLVPMSATLTQMCRAYFANPLVQSYGSAYFFPATDRSHYATCTAYEYFRKSLFIAQIGHGGRGKGPRLHDIRHTMAVHTLSQWTAEGKDIYTALPILMTYLGHSSIRSTEKYLRLVPESYAQITVPFETNFGDVFPEVTDENQ